MSDAKARLPRDERRAQLLSAALEVFTSAGYHAAATHENADRVKATVDAYFNFIEEEGEAYRLLFESDMSVEPAVRERLTRMTYDCAAAVSAVIAADTGIPDEAAMLLGIGLVGTAQFTARYWLERDGRVPREEAARLVANLQWRGISGYPRTLDERGKR
jgi:hypothetical protein